MLPNFDRGWLRQNGRISIGADSIKLDWSWSRLTRLNLAKFRFGLTLLNTTKFGLWPTILNIAKFCLGPS